MGVGIVFKKKISFFIFVVVIIICLLIVSRIYQTAGADSMKIAVPLKDSMADYKSVLVRGRYTSIAPSLDPSWFHDFVLEDIIATWAENNGMVPMRSQSAFEGKRKFDMIISVETDVETGLPYLGRHFKILNWHLAHISIRFIEAHSNELVCESQYNRPFLEMDPDDVYSMMLDKMVQKRYGLTDFSSWEHRQFDKSKIAIDLPVGFTGFTDREFNKKYPDMTILSLRFHETKGKNRVTSGLDIYFKEMTLDRYGKIKDEASETTQNEMHEYLQWLSLFHKELTKRNEFARYGSFTKYIKDYKNQQGRMVRAMAILNFKLRPEGPAIDDLSITRMLNSVEVL